MKALKIIGMIVGGLVALFLAVTAILPSSYRVERAIEKGLANLKKVSEQQTTTPDSSRGSM